MSRYSSPEQSIGFKYANTFRRISNLFASRLKPFGITPEQWTVLYQIHLEEGINQKQISLRTDKDQPTITRILDVLDKKELIQRKVDPSDRRAFLIFESPIVKKLMEDTIPVEVGLNKEIIDGITDEQLECLHQVLMQIQHNIDTLEGTRKL
ncbi:DNA-binding MarR family transcriptional regulator [Paenibacillus sp. DS2015]|uniref:MarR family winged helix-turn-helix transcriptional regulator n=1 Tax=Paenibacillus sp. DS2015 TaxID=3373917 RepID=UPI003D1D1588